MSSVPKLRLDWCSHEAAKYAVEKWHYSRRMPKSKLVKVGVWEDDSFVGAIIFGAGATPEIGSPYGLKQVEVCELVRVALRKHRHQTSKMMSIALRMLKRSNVGLRLVVSFADTAEGHHGGIYQANGWIFTGTQTYHAYRVSGVIEHPRTLGSRYGVGGQSIPWLRKNVDPNAERIINGAKHKYLMPLDDAMRQALLPLARQYPKRAGSAASGTTDNQSGGGGANPTPALSETLEANHGA